MKRRHLDVQIQGLRHSKKSQSLYLQTLQGHSGDAAPDTPAPRPGRVQRTNQVRIESKEISRGRPRRNFPHGEFVRCKPECSIIASMDVIPKLSMGTLSVALNPKP
jgi:hypothetical protein